MASRLPNSKNSKLSKSTPSTNRQTHTAQLLLRAGIQKLPEPEPEEPAVPEPSAFGLLAGLGALALAASRRRRSR
ncbi:MAG: PEP-CTERM sorting domain-containing protein [Opitutales bacterium]|nr:PEP-CTERM sorting domain-containing protein [Opitutales bacterium]